jgi:hypothetical protein
MQVTWPMAIRRNSFLIRAPISIVANVIPIELLSQPRTEADQLQPDQERSAGERDSPKASKDV